MKEDITIEELFDDFLSSFKKDIEPSLRKDLFKAYTEGFDIGFRYANPTQLNDTDSKEYTSKDDLRYNVYLYPKMSKYPERLPESKISCVKLLRDFFKSNSLRDVLPLYDCDKVTLAEGVDLESVNEIELIFKSFNINIVCINTYKDKNEIRNDKIIEILK